MWVRLFKVYLDELEFTKLTQYFEVPQSDDMETDNKLKGVLLPSLSEEDLGLLAK